MAEVYGSQRRPRKRWGRRLLITFIVLLIIVGGILVVADRLGASYAERVISDRVAQQVANQKASSEKPEVTIEGVPFLTQVVKGRYQEIKIKLRNLIKFLDEGDKTKVTLRYRGREMAHQEFGVRLIERVKQDLEPHAVVEQYPKMEGRQLIMVLAPKKGKKEIKKPVKKEVKKEPKKEPKPEVSP